MPRPLQKPRTPQGEHLTHLRQAAGLSQVALAQLIGQPQSTIAKWEARGTSPRADILPKLAKALGVTVDEVLNIPRQARAPKKRGPAGKVARVFDDVCKLPLRQQEQIVQVVSALVNQFKQRAA